MVQYNKNLINNETLRLFKKHNQTGGYLQNMFFELPLLIKSIIVIILLNILFKFIDIIYTLKLHAIGYPIVFSIISYYVYIILTFHVKNLGLSLSSSNKKNIKKIAEIIDDINKVLYTLPELIPQIPNIPEPSFNSQPFKGIRESIRSLQYPYTFKGSDYKLQINFPKLKIPFFDPLAGICCVWGHFEKILKIFEKAFEKPKKTIEAIAKVFIAIFTKIKEWICGSIDIIKKIVTVICSPIIGLLYTVIGFLTAIKALGGDVQDTINKLENIIAGMTNVSPKGMCGGGNINKFNNTVYEKNDTNDSIMNYTGPCINDIYSRIDVLRYENSYKDKICRKKIKKMSIFKIHRKELSEKNGLMKYINKYTERKFKTFQKKKLGQAIKKNIEIKQNTKIYKPDFIYYNKAIHDFMPEDELNKLNKTMNYIKQNKNNLNNTQHGGVFVGGFWDELRKLGDILSNIPKYTNIVCITVKKLTDLIRMVGKKIYEIINKITGGIPAGIKKFGLLVSFIGKIIEWFIHTIIDKGVRIIEAAVELVFNLSLGNLPPAISTKIFKPIKIYFIILLGILKLPFISFYMEIIEILTDIPRLFNTFADGLDIICIGIKVTLDTIVEELLAPLEEMKKIAEALKFWGGAVGKVNKLLYKHKYELNIMINKRNILKQNNNIDINYLYKLDNLIKDKKKKIKKIKKFLLNYDKIKTKNINYKKISK